MILLSLLLLLILLLLLFFIYFIFYYYYYYFLLLLSFSLKYTCLTKRINWKIGRRWTSVAEWLRHWNRDREAAGSNPGNKEL